MVLKSLLTLHRGRAAGMGGSLDAEEKMTLVLS